MKFIFLVYFLLLNFSSWSQKDTFRSGIDSKRKERIDANYHIKELKSSVILFRLNTNSKEIEYYQQHNNHKAANDLIEKTTIFNQKIIQSFRAAFDFCPVYFFDERSSDDIVKGKLENVIFLNDSLQIDSSIQLTDSISFYLMEYSFTKNDAQKLASEKDSTGYYDIQNLGIPAFVLMDRNFMQLSYQDPFPYYVKISNRYLSQKKMEGKVAVWNRKIEQFYNNL